MFDLQEELKNLPDNPGVYIMHDAADTVIYVGKAKILKNRVRQYFQNSAAHTPKVRAMVEKIAYFEYIITDSEIEALVLECNLIKKYRPRYNILLKDDKHYPYIKVTINEAYPRIFMTRTLKNDGAKYFGPYMGTNTIKNTLDIVQKIFRPPTCTRRFPQEIGKGRPCLNFHINNCFAPCTGKVSEEEYRAVFYDICAFLDGKHAGLLKEMDAEMRAASANMEYEKAASLRDKIQAIRAIGEKQKIINSDRQTDMDVLALAQLDNKAFAEIFFVRSGKVLGRENFRLDNVQDMTAGEILTDFVQQFYMSAAYIPREILLEYPLTDDLVADWLQEKCRRKVHVHTPVRGEKKKLVDMVRKNAELAANNYRLACMKAEEQDKAGAQLAALLGLEKTPVRIESYDISNIAGSENVGAMVVFQNGKPKRAAYRKFKIQSFQGADDYAAMQEVLYRRFRHGLEEQEKIDAGELAPAEAKFLPYPDCILVDGGKGHVAAAVEILEQMEQTVPVFGMVKDDRHRTRGLVSPDGEIDVAMHTSVFHFITRIQDEVHRTAISYHRKLHRKSGIKSELDEIPGIGPKRRTILLSAFQSVEKIRMASLAELERVQGMDRRSAAQVYAYFHPEDAQQ